MTTSNPTTPPQRDALVLRLATIAYLARFTSISGTHTESDLRLYFACCAQHDLAPLTMTHADVEHYVRWMQEVRFNPSTASRWMAVVTSFYRACVIDAVLTRALADDSAVHVVGWRTPPSLW